MGFEDKALMDVERKTTLTEQVYAQLRNGLLLGLWKPGEKLTARQLSRTLGVSLTPSREAIIRLANEGAIEVSETRMFSIPVIGPERYREINAIRMLLEPMATELAARKAPEALVDALEALNEDMRAKILAEEFDEALHMDSQFHLSIYAAAETPVLLRLIDTLWLQVGPIRNLLSREYRRQLVGYQNHRRMLQALRSRDAALAGEALRKDLSDGANAVLAVLGP